MRKAGILRRAGLRSPARGSINADKSFRVYSHFVRNACKYVH